MSNVKSLAELNATIGTAATEDVTTSATDTTDERIKTNTNLNIYNWTLSANTEIGWIKIADIDAGADDGQRCRFLLHGSHGFASGVPERNGGADIFVTVANGGQAENVNAYAVNHSPDSGGSRLVRELLVIDKDVGTSEGIWEIWIKRAAFARASVTYMGNIPVTPSTAGGTTTKPTGGYDKAVYSDYHSGNAAYYNGVSASSLVSQFDPSTTSIMGAIIESGYNTNGKYTKYADGTMICTTTATDGGTTLNIVAGDYYRNSGVLAYLPGTFIDTSYSVSNNSTNGLSRVSINATNSLAVTQLSKTSFTPSAPITCHVTVIGRWF